MKNTKYVQVVVVALATLSLVACGGGSSGKNKSNGIVKTLPGQPKAVLTKAQKDCPNPIVVEVKDGEERIKAKALVTGKADSWELVSLSTYSETTSDTGETYLINALEDAGSAARVLCDNIPAALSMSQDQASSEKNSSNDDVTPALPLSINSKNGEWTQTKVLEYEAKGGDLKASSKVDAAKGSVKTGLLQPAQKQSKLVIARSDDGTVAVRTKVTRKVEHATMSVYVEGFYRLKSAAPASADGQSAK